MSIAANSRSRASGAAQEPARRLPRRRAWAAKASAMSPEARKVAGNRELAQIAEYLSRNAATTCPGRWAHGALPDRLFGGEG